ncbi:MAG TPA: glycoside hydrolase family 5 protein [Fibrobacteria bacterium]|nr:glycoside hydrolase family 5 protein [Fibrobacteria bacterium]
MRGVNFGGWFSQIDAIQEKDPAGFPGEAEHVRTFLGPDDFRRVRSWGFDHVRLPVDWRNLFDESVRPREDMLAPLDRALDGILGQGLQVILDLHKCPGHDFHSGATEKQAFFTDPDLRRDCLKVWSHLGERYGDRAGVLLELLNEPVAPDPATWNSVKDELARHLRRVAPKATLVVGSNLWSNASEFAHLLPVDDDNILYSVHLYTPVVFTHQLAPWIAHPYFQRRRSYPGDYRIEDDGSSRLPVDTGRWDRDRMARHLEPVFAFRDRYRVEVACNEFGVYMGGPDRQSQLTWMGDVLDLFSEHGVGWSYWNYKNLDFGLISRGEGLFADSPQYANPDRTDFGILGLLKSH